MKVRVLYPAAFAEHKKPPAAGDIVELSEKEAQAFIDIGYAEPHDTKPERVERATAAPGEKRSPGRPRKKAP